MDIGVNYLTGGLSFKRHDKFDEEIEELKKNVAAMTRKTPTVELDLNSAFDPQPSR